MKKIILASLATLFVLGGVLYFSNNSPDSIAGCTEEALMCPDGSSTARAGEACLFSPCQYHGPYIGTLKNEGDNLVLFTDVYLEPNQAQYSIPLELRVSNTIKDFINQEVKISGDFSQGNTLKVSNIALADQSTIVLRVGEAGEINGLKIKLNQVVQDVRCAGLNCPEGGAISVRVSLEDDGGSNEVQFSSDGVPYEYNGYQIAIVDVSPKPVVNSTIAQADYEVVFNITRAD